MRHRPRSTTTSIRTPLEVGRILERVARLIPDAVQSGVSRVSGSGLVGGSVANEGFVLRYPWGESRDFVVNAKIRDAGIERLVILSCERSSLVGAVTGAATGIESHFSDVSRQLAYLFNGQLETGK
jgi:hypothetical protein